MATRDVYNKALDKMVVDTEKKMATMVGWTKLPAPQIATIEDMKSYAFAANRWNPLFFDEKYALGTRWNTIPAYPMYLNHFRNLNNVGPVATPECGLDYQLWPGQDWEFYKPIHAGDTFKTWNRKGYVREVKQSDPKAARTFAFLQSDCDFINQKDELAGSLKNYTYRTFYPGGAPKPLPWPNYRYPQEELEYLDGIARSEEISGPKIRFFEDIKVGDETKPVLLGPTYMGDNANTGGSAAIQMAQPIPKRELFHPTPDGKKVGDFLTDPETGLFVVRGGGAGRHWSDIAAQAEFEPRAFLYGVLSIYTMLRVVTNWAGDDGFVKSYHWRHIMRTPVGDALIGRGRVLNKRVVNGENLIDMNIWLENQRGNISETSMATISLLSKKNAANPYAWK